MGNANVSQSAAALNAAPSRRNPHFSDYQLTSVGPNHHVIHNGLLFLKIFQKNLCAFCVLLCFLLILNVCDCALLVLLWV